MALLAVSQCFPAARLDLFAVFPEAPLDLWSSARQVLAPDRAGALDRLARVLVAVSLAVFARAPR